jgi:hypothetical protein
VTYVITNHYNQSLPITPKILNAAGKEDYSVIQRITSTFADAVNDCGPAGTKLKSGHSCKIEYSITTPSVSENTPYSYKLSIDYGMSNTHQPLTSPINFTVVTTDYSWGQACVHSDAPSPFSCLGNANSLLVTADNYLYAAQSFIEPMGVASLDSGEWSSVGTFPSQAPANNVLIQGSNGIFYVGGNDSGGTPNVFSLIDGIDWELLGDAPVPGTNIFSLAYFNGAVYAGTDTGVYELSGSTWDDTALDQMANTLVVFSDELYVGTQTGVYVLNGSTWDVVGTAFESSNVSTLVEFNGLLTAGTTGSSADVYQFDGTNWNSIDLADSLSDNEIVTSLLAVDSNTLLAGTNLEVYEFDNTTSTWTQLGSSVGDVLSLAYYEGSYYAGLASIGVYQWNDTEWVSVAFTVPGNGEIVSLVEWDNDIYAATFDSLVGGTGGVYVRSNTSPPEWDQIGGNLVSITDMVVTDTGTFYVQASGTVYQSNNNLTAWIALPNTGFPNGIPGTSLFIFDGALLSGGELGGGVTAVYSLDPVGPKWIQLGDNDLENTVNTMTEFNNELYVGGTSQIGGSGVMKLNSVTNDWENIGSNQPGNGIVHVLYVYNGLLYAGTGTGIYVLNGPKWELAALGLDPNAAVVYSLLEMNGTLFAGTGGSIGIKYGDVFELVAGNWVSTNLPTAPGRSLLVFDDLLNVGTSQGLWVRDKIN